MNLALEQIVIAVIFLLILIVLVIFIQTPAVLGNQMQAQQELRNCCRGYIARDCTQSVSSMSMIRCDGKSFDVLARDVGFVNDTDDLNIPAIKSFCNCPLNRTLG